MQFLAFVAFDPFRQAGWVVQMCAALQAFLEFGDAAFDGFKHLLGLVTRIPEYQDPSIFTKLLPHSFRICLQ